MLLYLTYPLNALLMLLLPVALAVFLTRRFGFGWKLIGIGAVTFVASQVVHIPVNIGIGLLFTGGVVPEPPETYLLLTQVVILGLTAGLSEEIARYLVYRHWITSARTVLFLAVSDEIVTDVFDDIAGRVLIEDYQLHLIAVDMECEEIVQWIS